MNTITTHAYLVALIPFLCAVLIFLLLGFNRQLKNVSALISISGTFVALLLSKVLFYQRWTQPDTAIEGSMRWLTSGQFEFALNWSVDNLTAMMLVVVTFVSLLVQIYSWEYMSHEKGVGRYYGALSLFTFSMLLLVLAKNLLVLYAGWELVGISSYLLIGFFTFKPEAAQAAKKAFIVNRIGDFGFLLGILILFYMTQSLEFGAVTQGVIDGKLPGSLLALASVLLFFGPIGKSAQFPLHVWLPDAMEGPTPVSALIHAATMVAAGVYMVAKLMPIFAEATTPLVGNLLVLDFIAVIGGITAILAASIAVTQTDIKRVLAYSTVSQLGFMMMSLGMYQWAGEAGHQYIIPVGYTAGIFHLFTHAFFKAMLFLCSGSVIHAVHTNDMRQMGGLKKHMPITALTCLIGTASISGFPFITAGFWSKDELLLSMTEGQSPIHWVIFGLAAVAAILTAFYMFRLYFLTFSGEYRGELDTSHLHDPGWLMKGPLVLLAIPSIFAGFLGTPWTPKAFHFHSFIHFTSHHDHGGHHGTGHAGLDPLVLGVSLAVFLIGFGLAWAMYKTKSISAESLANKVKPLYQASLNKFYFDELYGMAVKWGVLGIASLSYFIDRFIVDGMLVNGLGLFTIGGSETLKYSQSGKINYYMMVLISALVILLIGFMWAVLSVKGATP